MQISIIIPVYNASRYLRECMDSVLAQTFGDFEVLLVDDGSTDGSGEACDGYARQDGRIRVFHKENGGVSSARNLGLDHARGEWICFADADDWLEPDCLETLMAHASPKVDLVVADFAPFGNVFDTEPLPDRYYAPEEWGTFCANYLRIMALTTPWNKLFRAEVIRNNSLRFDTKMHFNEDYLFNQMFILQAFRGGRRCRRNCTTGGTRTVRSSMAWA